MLNKHLVSKYIHPLNPVSTSLNPSGSLQEKIKCLLFDLYGTLFISETGDINISKKKLGETRQIEQLLLKFKIDKTPQTLLHNFFNTIKKKHAELKEKGIEFPEVEIDQIWMSVLQNTDMDLVRDFAVEFELIVNPVYPMPHLNKLIPACKDKNLLMGIISNAQFYTPFLFNWFFDSNMERLGFNPDLIFFSYRFGYAKPSNLLFQAAIEKLKSRDIHPYSVLYIGNDMLNDIYPAKNAGFQTALFAGDARSLRLRKDDPRCKNLSADLVITDLIQLLDLIQ